MLKTLRGFAAFLCAAAGWPLIAYCIHDNRNFEDENEARWPFWFSVIGSALAGVVLWYLAAGNAFRFSMATLVYLIVGAVFGGTTLMAMLKEAFPDEYPSPPPPKGRFALSEITDIILLWAFNDLRGLARFDAISLVAIAGALIDISFIFALISAEWWWVIFLALCHLVATCVYYTFVSKREAEDG